MNRHEQLSEVMHRFEQFQQSIEADFMHYNKSYWQAHRVQKPLPYSAKRAPFMEDTVYSDQGSFTQNAKAGNDRERRSTYVLPGSSHKDAAEHAIGSGSSTRKMQAEVLRLIPDISEQSDAGSFTDRAKHRDRINQELPDRHGSELRVHEGKLAHVELEPIPETDESQRAMGGELESIAEAHESPQAMDAEDAVQNDDRNNDDKTGKDSPERQRRVSRGRRILTPTFSQIKHSLLKRSRRGGVSSPPTSKASSLQPTVPLQE
ncbi:hypothetical protein KP509_37G018600 [Ceratopteris richardii]|nr:hypothetical protein KP509_37G018600 [Ceratopteris richardii]